MTKTRREFIGAVSAVVVGASIPASAGVADLGDEQFQRLNTSDEFVDCVFEDIVPGDTIRRAREPDEAYCVKKLVYQLDPPGLAVVQLARLRQ